MVTLQQYFELVNYRITEGCDYGWQCYGPKAHMLSAWNGVHGDGGWSTNVIFDTDFQTVYEVEICDYTNNRAYRMINPDYKSQHDEESHDRGELGNQAWDDVEYIDLDVVEDFLEKARAIIAGEDYDNRVQVPLDLDDALLFELMKQAHDRDLTLNQMVEDILRNVISAHETGTDNPIEFPVPESFKKSKKKKKGK
jgi:hypothetical protein